MRIAPTPWSSLGLNLPYVEGSMEGATPALGGHPAMARAAEAIGFDAVWVSDHVGFGDPEAGWSGAWESWTLLSALAVATARVRLGTYVIAVPFRNPALLAKMAETLDEVCGGRLILALGAGWNEPEFAAYGVPFERRFDRFEDGLRIIASMLRTGRADHEGRVDSARGRARRPRGPRPDGLPVMVGATAPRMLRLAAELADEWNAGMRTPAELAPLLGRAGGRLRCRGPRPRDDPALGGDDGGGRVDGRPGRTASTRAVPGTTRSVARRRRSPPACGGIATWGSTTSRSSSDPIGSRASAHSRR